MTPLRQFLAYFENTRGGTSIDVIARDMNLSPGRVENMIEFWVRKGRLQLGSAENSNCESCGGGDACPFTVDLPLCYEIVRDPTLKTE
jgi:hypothetical protein